MAEVPCCFSIESISTFTANAEGGGASLEASNQNAPSGSKMGQFRALECAFCNEKVATRRPQKMAGVLCCFSSENISTFTANAEGEAQALKQEIKMHVWGPKGVKFETPHTKIGRSPVLFLA